MCKRDFKEEIKRRLIDSKYKKMGSDVYFECKRCDVSWIVRQKTLDRDKCPICERYIEPSYIYTNIPYQNVKHSKFLSSDFVKQLCEHNL